MRKAATNETNDQLRLLSEQVSAQLNAFRFNILQELNFEKVKMEK
jgi:hypothetical protein